MSEIITSDEIFKALREGRGNEVLGNGVPPKSLEALKLIAEMDEVDPEWAYGSMFAMLWMSLHKHSVRIDVERNDQGRVSSISIHRLTVVK